MPDTAPHVCASDARDRAPSLPRALSAAPHISAIVPTLNEHAALPALVAALRAEVDEIIVSDGGSSDGTVGLAQELGARVVQGARGRGPQQHAGASVAGGTLLWFVHADTVVPRGAGAALRAATGPWGCFRVRIDSPDVRVRLAGRWMEARARWTGSCTGDMGIWCRRAVYNDVG